MRVSVMTALVAVVCVAGCSKATEEELLNDAAAAYQSGDVEEAAELYQECLEEYPEGSLRPEAYFALANIFQNDRRDLDAALRTYRKVVDQFPGHARAPGALFLIAFLHHNELRNLDSARVFYNEFLTKYPDHPMAPSARFELEHLGEEPDALLEGGTAGRLAAEKLPGQGPKR